MRYKALLIDIDDTLLDFKKCERFALKPIFDKYSIPYTDEVIESYSAINLKHWKLHELGKITHQETLDLRWIEFFKTLGLSCIPSEINKLYLASLANEAYLMPNAIEFLTKAKKSYRIYFASNGEAMTQYPRLTKSGLIDYADKIYLSDEIGYQKPNKDFFKYILKDQNLDESECVVIGDSLTSDILGAKNSNIDYIWYNPKKKVNLEIKNQINDLTEIFGKI